MKENRWLGRSKAEEELEEEKGTGSSGTLKRALLNIFRILATCWSASVRKTRASSAVFCRTISSCLQALSLERARWYSLNNVSLASRARVSAVGQSSLVMSPPLSPICRRRQYSWNLRWIALLAAMFTLVWAVATESRVWAKYSSAARGSLT